MSPLCPLEDGVVWCYLRSGVVRCCCGALAVLAAQHEANKVAIVAAGVPAAVVAAMARHERVATVQDRCLRVLRSLAMLSDTRLAVGETPELKERVMAAMETHATDASVQEYAAATIQQLAATRTCVVVALPVAAVAVGVWLCLWLCMCLWLWVWLWLWLWLFLVWYNLTYLWWVVTQDRCVRCWASHP